LIAPLNVDADTGKVFFDCTLADVDIVGAAVAGGIAVNGIEAWTGFADNEGALTGFGLSKSVVEDGLIIGIALDGRVRLLLPPPRFLHMMSLNVSPIFLGSTSECDFLAFGLDSGSAYIKKNEYDARIQCPWLIPKLTNE
jgi:hypothetical protein